MPSVYEFIYLSTIGYQEPIDSRVVKNIEEITIDRNRIALDELFILSEGILERKFYNIDETYYHIIGWW